MIIGVDSVNQNNNVGANSSNSSSTSPQPSNVQGVVTNQQVPIASVSNEVGGENTTPSTTVTNPTSGNNTTLQNQVLRSDMKEVSVQSNPPSKLRYVMLCFLFVGLFILVYFLPDISSYVSILKTNKSASQQEIITTGSLKCTHSRSTDDFDLSYVLVFSFTDNQLESLSYTSQTRGDRNFDAVTLDEKNTNCKNLALVSKNLTGVSVTCDLSDGLMTEVQKFHYQDINEDEVTAAYVEAGGLYPEFRYQQNMDSIEKTMKAQGYSCERNK